MCVQIVLVKIGIVGTGGSIFLLSLIRSSCALNFFGVVSPRRINSLMVASQLSV